MKFKVLRTKTEPKEFAHIEVIETVPMLFTSDLPSPLPMTATLKELKRHYKNNLSLKDLELVEFEIFEADTVGADIRNKLGPLLTVVNLLEIIEEGNGETDKLKSMLKKELPNCKESIKYIADLL